MGPYRIVISVAVVVGFLFAVMGTGTRGHHFLPPFIFCTGLVLAVGLIVIRVGEKYLDKKDKWPPSKPQT